jgi:hypothetical protein
MRRRQILYVFIAISRSRKGATILRPANLSSDARLNLQYIQLACRGNGGLESPTLVLGDCDSFLYT